MNQKEFSLTDINEWKISCAIEFHLALGPGLLEDVYEEAIDYLIENQFTGLKAVRALNEIYKAKLSNTFKAQFVD